MQRFLPENNRLTVAVPTFMREHELINTLEQVIDAIPEGSEVLVIDQTRNHLEEVGQQLAHWNREGRIRWIRQQPPSLTAARNRALKEARGDIVLFIDDDMLIPQHFFGEHLRWYTDESVSAVTGQIWNCIDPLNPPPLSNPERNTRPHSDVREVCEARNISGGNHSVRRAVAIAVGGYDPAFVGSALGEDLDFAQRLLLAGHRILYNPGAWLVHLGLKTGGCAVGKGSPWPEWQYSSGLLLYAFRHGCRQKNFMKVFWMALRNGPFRKEIVTNPLLWGRGCLGFLKALAYAVRHRRFESGCLPNSPAVS